MAFLTNTPGSFNPWNYTDENDFYTPASGKFGNESQWGSLTDKDFQAFARQQGYTGPKDQAIQYLLGMSGQAGGVVPFGQYNSGSAMVNAEVMHPLLDYVKRSNPQLWEQFHAGKSVTPDYTGGDLIANLWTAGAGGMAAAGAAAGAGAAEGAAAGGAGGAAGTGGAAAGEYGLGTVGSGTGIGGGSAGLGYGGVGGVETVGGIGSVGGGGAAAGSGIGAGYTGAGAGFDWSNLFNGLTQQPGGTTFGIPNNILEGIIKGGLGYLGAGKQGDAYQDVANQNLAIGAPYRNLLAQSYGKNFDLASQPGYGDAFNRMADIATRQWSTRGNPANTPGIAGGILDQVWQGSYLPALANYRGQLGQFGGLGLNTSGAAQLGAANSAGGQWEAIGSGLQTAIGQNPYEEVFKRMNPFPGSQNLGLTVGGVRYGG